MKKLRVLAVLLLVALVALVGCAPKATPAPTSQQAAPAVSQWDKVMKGAKREGKVVIYMGLGDDVQTAFMQGFERDTGLKAEILGLQPGDTKEKLRMEQQIGMPIADICIQGSMAEPSYFISQGFALPITATLPEAESKAAFRVHPFSWDPERKMGFVIQRMSNPTLLISTKLVKPGEEPQSWSDLLDPKWKGKMLMRDPRTEGPTNNSYPASKTLPEDYWRKLFSTQDVWLETKSGRTVDAVALGEKAISIWASTSRAETAIAAGAPLKFVHLKEGSAVNTKGGSIIKGAPHPNAALVFINWVISKEGQTALGKATGRVTLRNDINEDWIKIDAFKAGAEKKNFDVEATSIEQQNEVMAFFAKVIGKR